ncbi:MAG TPA: hypothetical protein VI565_06805, partial [Burkholderiales bacterium]|nr:hypothetical protein [Burkholderiales bacterium]
MGAIGWSQYGISASAMIRVFLIYLRLSAFICGFKILFLHHLSVFAHQRRGDDFVFHVERE